MTSRLSFTRRRVFVVHVGGKAVFTIFIATKRHFNTTSDEFLHTAFSLGYHGTAKIDDEMMNGNDYHVQTSLCFGYIARTMNNCASQPLAGNFYNRKSEIETLGQLNFILSHQPAHLTRQLQSQILKLMMSESKPRELFKGTIKKTTNPNALSSRVQSEPALGVSVDSAEDTPAKG